MKKSLFVLLAVFSLSSVAYGQGGTWTWLSGDSITNSPGVYGTQGIPSVNNHPPGTYEGTDWKDKQGNFWEYGGLSNITYAGSDLWKYNPVTNEWIWVKGKGPVNQPAVYGIKGVSNINNTPGERAYGSASWVDTTGNLWLLGGSDGSLSNCTNDLWRYDIASNKWTWMSGSYLPNQSGIYGTQGVPSHSNMPGARAETCAAWTDSLNNLWVLGGDGYDANGNFGRLNDLWKYDIAANEWTWMKGSSLYNVPAVYGSIGVADANNEPPAEFEYTKWKDLKGNFWVMPGEVPSANAVWQFDLSLNEWIWMAGTTTFNAGTYQSNCVFNTINMPSQRLEQRSSTTDNCGRFWLFGGSGTSNILLNDLWLFDPAQLKWEWLSGSNSTNLIGNYGTLGVGSTGNTPPSRSGALAWWGNDNKFYLFAGLQNNGTQHYNDLWVFSPDSNCVLSCGTSVIPPPVAGFQSNKKTICSNDCINLTNLSIYATSWQWVFPGGTPLSSSDQTPQVCYLTSGIYDVTLIASNSAGTDTITMSNYITVSPSPPSPVIMQVHNDTLIFSTDSSYKSYQWYVDTTLIPNATDTFLVISKGGNYNVQVTSVNACKIAVGINVVTGLQNYMKDKVLSISPNPVTDKLQVANYGFSGNVDMTIYNALGEKITYDQKNVMDPFTEIIFDVSKLPSGIYFIQLIGRKQRYEGRFVKE